MKDPSLTQLLADTSVRGFLFDMDGTLLNSLPASVRVWQRWGDRFGRDGAAILKDGHGMKVRDVIARLNIPGIDLDEETAAIFAGELADTDDIEEIAGARCFLESLPNDRWAVVTSTPHELAVRRLSAAGLPWPDILVSEEDVTRGKPDPQSYLIAAARLGVAADRCAAFEDAPAGLTAARRAGAFVIAITAAQGGTAGAAASVVLRDYRDLRIAETDRDEWRLTIG